MKSPAFIRNTSDRVSVGLYFAACSVFAECCQPSTIKIPRQSFLTGDFFRGERHHFFLYCGIMLYLVL